MLNSFIFAAVFLSTLIACDSPDGSSSGSREGWTACGPSECGPGQYCFDNLTGACESGCTSDKNCLDDEECLITDEFFSEGECSPLESSTEPADWLAACQSACDHFQSCGLGAGDASQCQSDCASLSEGQQRSIASCDDLSCGASLECLGVDCFTDSDCSGNDWCVDYTCM